LGFGAEKLAEAVVLTKGAGVITKAAEGADAVNAISPNVQKALNTLNEIKTEGGTVTTNSLSAGQELNLTIQKGATKIDLRVETHRLPSKYGGDGITPTRHMNVDLSPENNLPNRGHKILN